LPRGSEPGHRRPVVVVQSNQFNESRIETVIVAAISSNLRLGDAPGNVRVRSAESGLAKVSVVNVSQLLTLGRHFLIEKIGTLPAGAMNRVAEGLRLVLGL
jgi:mRNA interferase MazF